MPTSKLALISVTDKTGIAETARRLTSLNYKIISTGGSAALLKDHGVPVTPVSEFTQFPEILDGRVKTLHPRIFAGILQRKVREDEEVCNQLDLPKIDLVLVNLYDFARAASKKVDPSELIEEIDIGGPSLIRAAAKNYESTLVVVDPEDYAPTLDAIERGSVSIDFRYRLAVKAFELTSAFDGLIAHTLNQRDESSDTPRELRIALSRSSELRYGENPHQSGAFYRIKTPEPTSAAVKVLQGKEMSYNNFLDLDAGWALIADLNQFQKPACAIIKHASPCGVGLGATLELAYTQAFSADSTSAFGGIVVCNRLVDDRIAKAMSVQFFEIVAAPHFTQGALELFQAKPNLRVCELSTLDPQKLNRLQMRAACGGVLVQSPDLLPILESQWSIPTKKKPTETQRAELAFASCVAKHVRSNAIVITHREQSIGISGGQTSRIDACRSALARAGDRARHAVLASDGFFPFADSVEEAARAGIAAIIQPGGSKRDEETIAAADHHGVSMVFTHRRHFRH